MAAALIRGKTVVVSLNAQANEQFELETAF
jgi:hypothetical protein